MNPIAFKFVSCLCNTPKIDSVSVEYGYVQETRLTIPTSNYIELCKTHTLKTPKNAVKYLCLTQKENRYQIHVTLRGNSLQFNCEASKHKETWGGGMHNHQTTAEKIKGLDTSDKPHPSQCRRAVIITPETPAPGYPDHINFATSAPDAPAKSEISDKPKDNSIEDIIVSNHTSLEKIEAAIHPYKTVDWRLGSRQIVEMQKILVLDWKSPENKMATIKHTEKNIEFKKTQSLYSICKKTERLFLNQGELVTLGTDTDKTIQILLHLGVKMIIVTNEEKPITIYTKSNEDPRSYELTLEKQKRYKRIIHKHLRTKPYYLPTEKNSTGCGDAFA